MAKISLKKPDPSSFKGWTFVVLVGGILAVLALLHQGGVAQLQTSVGADGSTGCQVEVVIDNLNVRRAANQDLPAVAVLTRGARLDATRVITNGYRQLEDGNWALTQGLAPLAGSNCS